MPETDTTIIGAEDRGEEDSPSPLDVLSSWERWIAEVPVLALIVITIFVGLVRNALEIGAIDRRVGDPSGSAWVPFRVTLGVGLLAGAAFLIHRAAKRRKVSRGLFWVLLIFGASSFDHGVAQLGQVVTWQRFTADWTFEPFSTEELSLGLAPGVRGPEVRAAARSFAVELEPEQPGTVENVFGSRSIEVRFLYRRFTIEDDLWFLVREADGLWKIDRHRSSSPGQFAGSWGTTLHSKEGRWVE